MKRVAPSAHEVALPRENTEQGGVRSLFAATTLTTASAAQHPSACLGCPDEPCARFTSDELARAARIQSPYAPESATCPTEAIARNADGTMTVQSDKCLGCGLCVMRCPVGAIHLDPQSAIARVEQPSTVSYERLRLRAVEFEARREAHASNMTAEAAPFADAAAVIRQVARAMPFVEGVVGQRVLRLLARNVALLSGAAARLKNVGDNNAPVELVIDAGKDLYLIEVEPGTDTPDAIRRALSGIAVAIARFGANREEVTAAVVVPRLPNERVELYRVAGDVYERLDIATFVVPLALLLLAVRAGGGDLGLTLPRFSNVNGTLDLDELTRFFGDLGDPISLGMVPSK